MNPGGIALALTSLFLLTAFPIAAQRNEPTRQQQEARDREESGSYLRKWHEEEVAYIITNEEETAFKKLKTDEERQAFIELFWLRRDPTPDTPDNEYMDDYYRRIVEANEKFSSGIPGWRTDRGRIYIMHGEPDEVVTYAMGGTYYRDVEEGGGVTATFPFERWRYRYIEGIGNNIVLEFVDSSMSGEYKLTFDPSEKDALLHVPGAGLTDYEIANNLDKADRLNREHAAFGNPLGQDVRMSTFDRLQLSNDILRPPPVKFKDLEALVASRQRFTAVPFDVRTDLLKITDTTSLVPITLQVPYRSLSFKEEQGVQNASMRISAEITNLQGRPVRKFDDMTVLQVTSALFRPEGVALFQKVENLQPGRYRLRVLVEDVRTGNKGTQEIAFDVKRFPEDNLAASSLILADDLQPLPRRTVSAQFQIGSLKVRPSVKNEFKRDQNMNLFLQVYNLKLDKETHKPSVSAEVLITRDGQEVKKIVDEISEVANAAQQMNFIQQVAMNEFDPGEYAVQVRIKDNLADNLLVSSSKFTVR